MTAQQTDPAIAATRARIALSGQLRAEIGRDVAAGLPGRQERALFAFLVVNRHRRVSRDELLDVLWPGGPPPQADVDSVLDGLRRALGDAVVEDGEQLRLTLGTDAEVDIEQALAAAEVAERALSTGDPRAAVGAAQSALKIIARPILPGVEGAWVDRLRAELTACERGLLEVLARAQELARQGQRGATAAPASPPPPPAPPSSADVPLPLPLIGGVAATRFVGREGHLARLQSPWLEASTSQRRLALLVGEAGVGKTRLAAQFAGKVHRTGAAVLYGRCEEEPLLSYQPFIEALRHTLRHGGWGPDPDAAGDLDELARILPEVRPQAAASSRPAPSQDPETERYRLFEAVARLVRRASRRAPLLLILDDLHWADKPTLLLLRHLLRHPDPARLMVLGMARAVDVREDHPLTELIADLRRERRFDRIALDGLSEREADALVAARLATPPSAAFVRALRARTEGNPFFMEETLRALIEANVLKAGAQAPASALETIGVPESVADVILSRLGRVSDQAAEALTIGATVGHEFHLGVVQALLDVSADRALEVLEEAIDTGLVVEVADCVDRFAFCHALARDAIYGRVSRSRRLRLHLRVARALQSLGASAGELARHFFAAREIGAAGQAAHYALLAGDEAAASLAYEDSAEHYRRALEAIGADPAADESRRCDILLALGRVQWQAGDVAAQETYFQAAESARARGAAVQLGRAALGLGERYWEASAVDERYAPIIAEAVRALSDKESRLRARLMGRLAESLHFTAQQGYGMQLSADALAMARRLGDAETLVMALMSRHVTLLHVEHLDERMRLSEEVLALSGEHRALRAEALHWRLLDVFELGALDEARRHHAELSAIAGELRQPLLEHLAVGWQGVFAHLAGDVVAAEQLASQSFNLASRAQVGYARSYLSGMLFTLRRQQGRVGELLPAIEALAVGGSANLAWTAALALAEVETGDVAAGRARYEQLVADGARAVPRDWYWFFTVAMLAETCCALGDGARAQQLHDLLAPFARRYVQVIFAANWGSVQRQLGMLAAAVERYDDAEEHFRAALEANGRIGAVLMRAETQCAYGALLIRRGAPGDRERATMLAGLVEQVAAPRGLDGLRRRADALTAGERA